MMTTAETEQHMVALAAANKARFAVADAKRELGAGQRDLESVLRDPACGSGKVSQILAAQTHWGPVRAAELMSQLGLAPTVRVRDLTARQILVMCQAAKLPKSQRWQVIVRETGVAV